MDTDFLDAHQRHWADAELLKDHSRWANADHLYGMSAECGLKRLMLLFGMKMKAGRPEQRDDRQHVDKIWERFETYRSKRGGPEYAIPTNSPFDNWEAAQRYSARVNFDETRISAHPAGADIVRGLINKARRNGLIP